MAAAILGDDIEDKKQRQEELKGRIDDFEQELLYRVRVIKEKLDGASIDPEKGLISELYEQLKPVVWMIFICGSHPAEEYRVFGINDFDIHPDTPIIQCNGLNLSEGSEGGPVFNLRGEVVGLITMKLRDFEAAIHVTMIRRFLGIQLSKMYRQLKPKLKEDNKGTKNKKDQQKPKRKKDNKKRRIGGNVSSN